MNPLKQGALSRPALNPVFIEADPALQDAEAETHGFSRLSPPVAAVSWLSSNCKCGYEKISHSKCRCLRRASACHNCSIFPRKENCVLCQDCRMLADFQRQTRQYCALITLPEDDTYRHIVSLPHQRVKNGRRLTWSGPPPCDSSTELDVFEPDQSEGHRPGAVNPDRVGVLVDGKFLTNDESFALREPRERVRVWGNLKKGELDPATARLYSQSELEGTVKNKMFLAFEDAVERCIQDEVDKAKQEMRDEMQEEMQTIAASITSAVEFLGAQEKPAAKNITCTSGHPLSISSRTDGPYNTGWFCDRCKAKGRTTTERWHCTVCNPGEDYCFGCIGRVPRKAKEKAPEKPASSELGMCVICLSEPSTHATTPCGHLCMCQSCSGKLTDNKCPVCRGDIASTIRIHNSGAPDSDSSRYDKELVEVLALSLAHLGPGTGSSVMFSGKS